MGQGLFPISIYKDELYLYLLYRVFTSMPKPVIFGIINAYALQSSVAGLFLASSIRHIILINYFAYFYRIALTRAPMPLQRSLTVYV